MQRSRRSQPSGTALRGVTLTEVLISLMILSLGVVMVMSLFPAAVLKTLQANQITNAAILSYNVDALLAQYPELVFDPDGDGDVAEHVRQALTRNYIVDPVGFHVYAEEFQDGIPRLVDFGFFGNNGAASPAQLNGFSIPRFGGGLKTAGGNDAVTGTAADAKALRLLATTFASQSDNWSTDIETYATGVALNNALNAIGVKLGNLQARHLQNVGSSSSLNVNTPFVGRVSDPAQYRIVVFSLDDQYTQAFPLTYLDLELEPGTEIGVQDDDIEASWTETNVASPLDFNNNGKFDEPILPNEFRVPGLGDDPNDRTKGTLKVGRVLLQSRRTSEFSWMLTVRRRADGNARNVDVVVRFKNGVDPKDEELFPANCLGGTHIIGVKNNGANEPRLKRGGFAFDIVNAVWYRITSVQEKPLFEGPDDFSDPEKFNWKVYDYRVTVETQIRALEGTGSDADDKKLNGNDVSTFGRVMFPTGVIEVYPLGSKNVPDSLR